MIFKEKTGGSWFAVRMWVSGLNEVLSFMSSSLALSYHQLSIIHHSLGNVIGQTSMGPRQAVSVLLYEVTVHPL